MLERCLQIIEKTAKVPSFSSYEEVIHPVLLEIADAVPDCETEILHKRNLLLRVPGKRPGVVAFSAHLDKINHFGEHPPDELPINRSATKLTGQLDNTAGIGVVMTLLEESQKRNWPELYILLSEMEESTGLKKHPHLLRNGGENLHHGMGAERISKRLADREIIPDAVITIDTTPLFKGEPGVAVYHKHWEFTGAKPSGLEEQLTRRLVERLLDLDPDLLQANNTNDYLTYGKLLNALTPPDVAVPSIAVEPSIEPYHTKNEEVYIADLDRVLRLLTAFLDSYQDPGSAVNPDSTSP